MEFWNNRPTGFRRIKTNGPISQITDGGSAIDRIGEILSEVSQYEKIVNDVLQIIANYPEGINIDTLVKNLRFNTSIDLSSIILRAVSEKRLVASKNDKGIISVRIPS